MGNRSRNWTARRKPHPPRRKRHRRRRAIRAARTVRHTGYRTAHRKNRPGAAARTVAARARGARAAPNSGAGGAAAISIRSINRGARSLYSRRPNSCPAPCARGMRRQILYGATSVSGTTGSTTAPGAATAHLYLLTLLGSSMKSSVWCSDCHAASSAGGGAISLRAVKSSQPPELVMRAASWPSPR